jgi:hypothetical protein
MTGRARRVGLVLALAVACAGCAENAIFTLVLDVPPPASGRNYVVVEARSGMIEDFGTDWQQTQISGIPLVAGMRNEVRVSFEADGDEIAQKLWVKVRFCVEDQCNEVPDGNAPEQRYVIERAFYQGRYTELRQTIDPLPPEGVPAEVDIDKCSIAAPECIDGSPTSWCVGDLHYCE